MAVEQSFLIECSACGIENFLSDFIPGRSAVCNQCRETLLNLSLVDSHKGHTCDDCGMAFLLKNETEFTPGESQCPCGSSDFSSFEIGPYIADLKAAETSSITEQDTAGGEDDHFNWCRSDQDEPLEGDYNNMFDDDPGFGR
tara:strand:+ start:69 stop:494 length:426 start_codon:yes stop_codon:yes gene_type:complete